MIWTIGLSIGIIRLQLIQKWFRLFAEFYHIEIGKIIFNIINIDLIYFFDLFI